MEMVEEFPAPDHKPRDRRSAHRQRCAHKSITQPKPDTKTLIDGLLDRLMRYARVFPALDNCFIICA
jgi:hypothetical protein